MIQNDTLYIIWAPILLQPHMRWVDSLIEWTLEHWKFLSCDYTDKDSVDGPLYRIQSNVGQMGWFSCSCIDCMLTGAHVALSSIVPGPSQFITQAVDMSHDDEK